MNRPALLAWSLWGLWLAIAVTAILLDAQSPGRSDSGFALGMAGYVSIGTAVAVRRPENAVGWLLIAIGLGCSLQVFGDAVVSTTSDRGWLVLTVAWVTGWLFNMWALLIVVFLPLIFPDGRLLTPRWRPVWWLAAIALLSSVAVTGLTPGELAVTSSVENPVGVNGSALIAVEAAGRLTAYLVGLAVLLALASVALRFRRSRATERQQLKWFTFAAAVAISALGLTALSEVFPNDWGGPVGSVGWTIVLASAVLGIPLATGIAILRHRLYDIDVVINRTLVYTTLTAILVLTYVSSVLLLRLLLNPVLGQSPLAIAASTLLVAALFQPARRRIQNLVDRRFFRRKYDAARTLDDFATQLRHELDLDAVAIDLQAAVTNTVQPTHQSLWLRRVERSTS